MQVYYRCPHCDAPLDAELTPATQSLPCGACGKSLAAPAGSVTENAVTRCLVCPSEELYVRKDFSQRLGVTVVAIGIVVSSLFWYWRMPNWTFGVLFATALLDVVAYMLCGNALQCYRCGAVYRGLPNLEQFEPFDLETHEKHRQQQIRLQEAERAQALRASRTPPSA